MEKREEDRKKQHLRKTAATKMIMERGKGVCPREKRCVEGRKQMESSGCIEGAVQWHEQSKGGTWQMVNVAVAQMAS